MWYDNKGGDFLNSFIPRDARISIITGHYGSGKTNFAVNLALTLQQLGKAVTVVDLDIVNPYFRTADFASLFQAHDIELVTPPFANTNLDLPTLSAQVDAALIQTDRHVIIDVGGDDAGAIALGRYVHHLDRQGYCCYYLFNPYRYLTKTPEESLEILQQIQTASRIHVTDLVNNANLGHETTVDDVLKTADYADKLEALSGVPLCCTCLPKQAPIPAQSREYFAVDNYIQSI